MERWIRDADYQCHLIICPVLNHESIPQHEKIYSLFKRHTEWISKGKAGVPVEPGLRVSVIQDQFGFTLHHLVMEKQTDDEVTVPIAQGAKQRFPRVSQVSYDRGFWSKANLEALEEFLDRAVLPKKGKWSEQDRQRERHPEFVRAKRKHSAAESDINALEQHGLDRTPASMASNAVWFWLYWPPIFTGWVPSYRSSTARRFRRPPQGRIELNRFNFMIFTFQRGILAPKKRQLSKIWSKNNRFDEGRICAGQSMPKKYLLPPSELVH